jgi:hypothetical protein
MTRRLDSSLPAGAPATRSRAEELEAYLALTRRIAACKDTAQSFREDEPDRLPGNDLLRAAGRLHLATDTRGAAIYERELWPEVCEILGYDADAVCQGSYDVPLRLTQQFLGNSQEPQREQALCLAHMRLDAMYVQSALATVWPTVSYDLEHWILVRAGLLEWDKQLQEAVEHSEVLRKALTKVVGEKFLRWDPSISEFPAPTPPVDQFPVWQGAELAAANTFPVFTYPWHALLVKRCLREHKALRGYRAEWWPEFECVRVWNRDNRESAGYCFEDGAPDSRVRISGKVDLENLYTRVSTAVAFVIERKEIPDPEGEFDPYLDYLVKPVRGATNEDLRTSFRGDHRFAELLLSDFKQRDWRK